jgi:hypothetical protein
MSGPCSRRPIRVGSWRSLDAICVSTTFSGPSARIARIEERCFVRLRSMESGQVPARRPLSDISKNELNDRQHLRHRDQDANHRRRGFREPLQRPQEPAADCLEGGHDATFHEEGISLTLRTPYRGKVSRFGRPVPALVVGSDVWGRNLLTNGKAFAHRDCDTAHIVERGAIHSDNLPAAA